MIQIENVKYWKKFITESGAQRRDAAPERERKDSYEQRQKDEELKKFSENEKELSEMARE